MTRASNIVRVASYNVRALKDDRQALIEVIRRIDPDILLLQEAPRHPLSGGRISRFAEKCALTWSGGGSRGWMSTTMLVSMRLQVNSFTHHNVPVRRGDEPRGFAVADVALPGFRPFRAVSLHMTLRSTERGRHAQLIMNSLGDELPLVMGGDVNEEPGHEVWKTVERTLHKVTPDALTSPARNPGKEIDVIWASPVFTASTPHLEVPERLLIRATDHRPVYVDLDLSALKLP